LLSLAVVLASQLPARFAFWLAVYFVTTVAYSLGLKKIALIDVLTLAGLYTLRIVAGASATGVAFSTWLGGFSIFFFLSLAIAKRYTELDNLRKADRIPTNGRGYRVEDIEQLRSFGTASGYAAIVVFVFTSTIPRSCSIISTSKDSGCWRSFRSFGSTAFGFSHTAASCTKIPSHLR